MRRLTITYDRRDALFHVIEDTEHGGRAEYRCAYGTAREACWRLLGTAMHDVAHLGPLMDGRITRITLEAP